MISANSSLPIQSRGNSAIFNERGLKGLHNIGNTCFLNSVIQCLSNTRPILEYILANEYLNEIKNQSKCLLIKRFAELIQGIWSEQKNALDTHLLKHALVLYTQRFNGYGQHDAQEFLRYLLGGLHEDINRARSKTSPRPENKNNQESLNADDTWKVYLESDNSKIVDVFGGLLKSVLKCTTCQFTSTVFEPFWDLSLPLPSTRPHSPYHRERLQLSNCLDLFTQEERLSGDEKPTCSKCKSRQTCTKQILIQKFPEILVIHLKRFSNNGMNHKMETFVDFPLDSLNLTPYAAESKRQNTIYDLYGVVNHYGTCQFGHYTANCKHPFSGMWHRFNDRSVTRIDEEFDNKSDAYILFYGAKLNS